MAAAVKSMKRIQLELGGKNPLIVCQVPPYMIPPLYITTDRYTAVLDRKKC